MSRMRAVVTPAGVNAALAHRRPPACTSVTLEVLPNRPGDNTRLEDLLRFILTEVVASWPNSTIWATQFAGGYLQGWHESPTMLLEFASDAALDAATWEKARGRGWIDPKSVAARSIEFESRAAWGPNPVQELRWSSDGLPAMVRVLADAAEEFLGFTDGDGVEIKIWCRLSDENAAEPEVTTAARELDTSVDMVLTSVPLR